MTSTLPTIVDIKHGHLFCGLGGGAKGFNKASPRVGNMVGEFRCLGGIDVDPAAIRDFNQLAGVPGTVMDLFDRAQYIAFHGHEPPVGWREATPEDIRRAMGGERPNIWFLSAPCKGFSGLLNETMSKTLKYQALNRLTLRGIWLALEAYADDPVELLVFENVPRIATRGRHLLDQIVQLLQSYGYAVAETMHDCGEIGGLSESRKRFLLVARHQEKVQPFLYEPIKKNLKSVGSVLGRMPIPGDPLSGPMHRIPSLQWKTWVRLALVEAGSDWRSLGKLAVEDGYLRDLLIVPEFYDGNLGVNAWENSVGTIAGRSAPSNGAFSVADPCFAQSAKWHDGQALGVRHWDESTGTVAGQQGPLQGAYSVADHRVDGISCQNVFRVEQVNQQSRMSNGIVIADPKTSLNLRRAGDNYLTGGHYGVRRWADSSGAVTSSAKHDNGYWSVADPRMPAASEKLICAIRSLDGTWHRPFTTLEVAAIQSLIDPEEKFELDGLSDAAWRERIGNAVPPDAATAIGEVMGTTYLLALSGETFVLSATPIWVRDVAVAIALPSNQEMSPF